MLLYSNNLQLYRSAHADVNHNQIYSTQKLVCYIVIAMGAGVFWKVVQLQQEVFQQYPGAEPYCTSYFGTKVFIRNIKL